MQRRTVAISALAVVAWSTGAFAQGNDTSPIGPSYALDRGKIEIALAVGVHKVEWQGTDLHGVPNVVWGPAGDALIGAGLGVGITPHFSVQIGFSLIKHKNDMYWRPEEPHDPYLATANLLTFTGGIRYDIRNRRYRVRPYVGGGAVAARFGSIHRGPTEWCPVATGIPAGSCFQMAPELFTGTRVTGHFDGGVNFSISRRWAFSAHMRVFRLEGSGTAPAIPADKPTGKDTFWHDQLFGALVLRVR